MSDSRPEMCVGAIVRHDDLLLLIRRGTEPGRGQWSLPGGRVEFGESMADAVVREVAEEAGLEVICGAMVGWVERFGPAHHFVIADFAATPAGATDLRAGTDADDAAWVPLTRVTDFDLVDGLATFLTDHGVIDDA